MDNMNMGMMILFLAGLLFAAIGVFMLLRKNKLKKVCTARTDGTVTDCTRHVSRKRKGGTKVTYNSTFTYSVNGVEYVKSVNRRYSEGERVTVHYDPSDPNRHYPDKLGIFGELFFIAFGALFMILPILVHFGVIGLTIKK